jgi:hypothetical protein
LFDSSDGMRLIRLKAARCGLQEGGYGGLGQGHRGKFYLLSDSPDGMRLIRLQEGGNGGLGQVHRGKFYLLSDSPDGMRLIRLKAAHCGLQEGGDGGLGQVGGELGAHPEAAAQQEGMDGTVEVGQHHTRQKVSNVKVHVAGLRQRRNSIT